MGYVAAVVAVVGLAYGVDQQEKSASKQRESGRVQRASQKSSDRQALRQRERELRIRQAQLAQAASSTGTGVSSGAIGAASSLNTQYSALQGSLLGQQNAMEAVGQLNDSAAKSQFKSQVGFQVSALASSAFTQSNAFQNIFAQQG